MFEEFIQYQQCIALLPGWVMVVLALAGIWSLAWKGFALWKASKYNSLPWFIVLLVVNTMGILEILYIFWLNKYGRKQ